VLGLADMLDRKPRQLSGGQRQRVAMGRAIVREPAVFLMDEPLSNLDAKLRVQMRSEVLRVHRKIGVAALYVTHDQTEAMTMGDRVAVLRAGVLQQCSDPRELYECPANVFVAAFIGSPSMNLYEASLEAGGDAGAVIVLGSQKLPLPARMLKRNPALTTYLGRSVTLGIRPEHLSDPAQADAELAAGAGLAADVDYVEVLGSEQLAHFTIDARKVGEETLPAGADQGEIVAASVAEGVARIDPRSAIRTRGRAVFGVDVERLHFFDPATGAAIAPAGPRPASG
jgi:multiple sugar transport system ATP-binding protein